MTDARVYIATTEGPALVQRLAAEEGLAEAALSAVCLDGTTTRLPITGAYTYFVRDHVRELSGAEAYRLDLDQRIDGGSSWMLGAWVAHFLLTENRLAMREDAAETAIFATGEVAFAANADRRAEVRAVAHMAEKVERLAERIDEESAAGRRVLLLTPESNREEADAALKRLSLHNRVTLHAVSETPEIFALLDSRATLPVSTASTAAKPLKRRNRVRLVAALVICILAVAAGAGYFAWLSAERGWDELLRKGRYLELGHSLDGFALPHLAALYRKRLGEGLLIPQTPEIVVLARRPADGGACAGLRFRRVGMKDTPVAASGAAYQIDKLRSLCGFTVVNAGGKGGHVWLSLEFLSREKIPSRPSSIRRMASGSLTDEGLRLFQELPLYLEESWTWRVTAVWAPVRSEDVEQLLKDEKGLNDEALLTGLKGFGVSIVRARITLGNEAVDGVPNRAPRIESFR